MAATTGGRREFRHFGLFLGRRIVPRRGAPPVLQEGDTAQTGFGFAVIVLVGLLASATALVGRRMSAAILLRLPTGLTLRLPGLARLARLAFLARFAPTEVVALNEPAHRLDHPIVVIGILPIGLGQDAIARGRRFAGQCLVFVEDLMRVAAHPDVGTAAVEDLVSIGWAVRIVMLLVVVLTTTASTTAATIATAARSLTIVWSH